MSDPLIKRCPKCKGRVERLLSAGAGVIVKGGAVSSPQCGRDAPCCGLPSPCYDGSCRS